MTHSRKNTFTNNRLRIIAIVLTLITIAATIPFGAMNTIAAWNGTTASKFESGNGSEENPYIIKTAEQLALLATNVNNGEEYQNVYFKLEASIELSTASVKRNWPGIGKWYIDSNGETQFDIFRGTFDGNGKTISGLYVSYTGENGGGLFGTLCGTVKNLKITNAYVKTESMAGILAPYAGYGSIENCNVSGTVIGNQDVGGIVGFSHDIQITNCTNSANIDGESYVGGIAGEIFEGQIDNCTNAGSITATNMVGGIAGQIDYKCTVSNSTNSGKIQTKYGGYIGGGIVGQSYGSEIYNCTNRGEVIGIETIGGIVGYAERVTSETNEVIVTKVTHCVNTGKIGKLASSEDYHEPVDIGGIVGTLCRSTLTDCYNFGNVLGYEDVGGIAGWAEEIVGNLENCYNDGDVIGVNYIAGIAGYAFSESTDSYTQIIRCTNVGDISGEYCIAGIAGLYGNDSGKGLISECYNKGNIEAVYYAGGIASRVISQHSDCVVSYCVNDGKVSLISNKELGYGGGIIAEATNAKLLQCVNNGTSSYDSNNHFGGIVGHSHQDTIKVFDCKYLNTSGNLGVAADCGNKLTTDIATAVSKSNLTSTATFDTYDFVNTFKMGENGVFPANAPMFIRGDVNSDGIIDMKDYQLIKRYCFDTAQLVGMALIAADTDKNNTIDVKDYSNTKRHCFGTFTIK